MTERDLGLDESKSILDYYKEDSLEIEKNLRENKTLGAYIIIAIGDGTTHSPNYNVRIYNTIDTQAVSGVLGLLDMQWKFRIMSAMKSNQQPEDDLPQNHPDVKLSKCSTKH